MKGFWPALLIISECTDSLTMYIECHWWVLPIITLSEYR